MLTDFIHTLTKPAKPNESPPQIVLIYIIPGNPGLIEYYRDFINALTSTLQSNPANNIKYDITGHSLPGFELTRSKPGVPYTLQDTIGNVQYALESTVAASKPAGLKGKLPVILIGHSVGAYILLEILRLRREAAEKRSDYEIVGGISLFPTVVDIAKSATGRKAAPLTHLPFLPHLLHLLSHLLTSLLPSHILLALVKSITRMPPAAAKTTSAFLSSPQGVLQSIFLAQHELREINERYYSPSFLLGGGDDAPGNRETGTETPGLFFLWGQHDHWVHNASRDAFIASHAAVGGKTKLQVKMEIETRGLPHAFCLRHNGIVAEMVGRYVVEIMRRV